MQENDKAFLKNSLEAAFKLRDDFFYHELNTRLQLYLAQTSYFQTISAILAGFAGVAVAVGITGTDTLFIIAVSSSLLTLIITTSINREYIDAKDLDLRTNRKYLDKAHEDHISKIVEAVQQSDLNIYFDYAKSKSKEIESSKKNEKPGNYSGEIITFIFYFSIFINILAIILPPIDTSTLFYILGSSLIVSAFAGFFDWSMSLAIFFSGIVKKILNKQ